MLRNRNRFAVFNQWNTRNPTLTRKPMKAPNAVARVLRFLSIVTICLASTLYPAPAHAEEAIPAIIKSGFSFFAKDRPEHGIDAWRVGGLVGEEFRSIPRGTYFREAEKSLGKFTAYEHITTKMIGTKSKIVYIAINYERGAIYSRFLTYRTEKDWVVQSMYFNVKPEASMPWLAFESEE